MPTLSKFVGDVVLGNVGSSDLGYCFEEITVTYAANMDVGSVVNSSGVWIAKAAAANTYGVIVDMKAKNLDGKLTVGDVVLGNVGSSDLGYCFEEITVTYAANMDVGSVVNSSIVTGKQIGRAHV